MVVFPSGRICIVTDDNVDRLYGDKLIKMLDGKYETVKFVFEHGEKSKNIITYASLLNFLAENKLTRSDAIVAFGGGDGASCRFFCADGSGERRTICEGPCSPDLAA